MVEYFRQFLASPVFEQDEEKTNRARVLHALLVSIIITIFLTAAIEIPYLAANKTGDLIFRLLLLGLLLATRRLMVYGYVNPSSRGFIAGMWLLLSIFIACSGGLGSITSIYFLVLTVMAGLLLGPRTAIIVAVASALVGLGLVVAENAGYPLPRVFPLPPLMRWMNLVYSLILVIIPLNLVLRTRAEALALARQELAERRRIEEALRQSEEKYRQLVSHSSDAIFSYDAEGRYRYVNEAFARRVGQTPDEIIGKTPYDIYPEADACKRLEIIKQAFRTGDKQQVEVQLTAPTGEVRYYLTVVDPVKDQHGHVLSVSAISTDITERKRIEVEREQLINELEAKNSELERFTYTVSHDLKSPLITIRGFLGYLEKDALAGRLDRLKADINRINEATDKMGRLLNDLLELSRIGRLMNPPENVPFQAIVREALALVQGRLAERGVTVEVDEKLPPVYGDRARLVEVIQNLVDNAAKFMGDQPQPRIEIGGRESEGKRIFFVRDNGIGIAPEHLDKVFGLFDKLNPHSEGTGIGLALVKRIVEVHGGHIWVESAGPSRGSTFCFTLRQPEATPIRN